MKIPVYSLTEVVSALVAGNGSVPPAFDLKKLSEIKKSIPVEMTELEKKFDSQTNKEIFEQILISHQIRSLIIAIIEERNIEFFKELERVKRKDELEQYIKSKIAEQKFLEPDKITILEIVKKNEAIQFYIEKIVALEKLISELENQNEILIAIRDNQINHFVKSVSVSLKDNETFNKIPENERDNTLKDVFDSMYASEKIFEEKQKLKANHLNEKKAEIINGNKNTPIIFSHSDLLSYENKKKEAVINAGSLALKSKLDFFDIPYDEIKIQKIIIPIYKDYKPIAEVSKVVEKNIQDNNAKIENALEEMSNTYKKLDSGYKKVDSDYKKLDSGYKEVEHEENRFGKIEKKENRGANLANLFSDSLKSKDISSEKGPNKGPQLTK